MLVFEFKAYGKPEQFKAVDDAIRTGQFIRNKCIRYWMDNRGTNKATLSALCKTLAAEFPFADELNSMARQAHAERAWASISRFYDNCKKKIPGKKGYPKFKKYSRSVEYKTSGWKLDENRKGVTFTDKKGIGHLKVKGGYDLNYYSLKEIKRVRITRCADGYYVQFCIKCERNEQKTSTGSMVGLDVGLKEFYTDSNGETVSNPRFLRKSESRLKLAQQRLSKKSKGSKNRAKARTVVGRKHLKISRQRKDWVTKIARCVTQSNDLVAYENLQVRNMVKNHCLAKSIHDASWSQFRVKLEYFGKVFGTETVAVAPHGTSQECSACGESVKKSLSTRTHVCQCGCVMDRDENAAINILRKALGVVGQTIPVGEAQRKASGDENLCVVGASQQSKFNR